MQRLVGLCVRYARKPQHQDQHDYLYTVLPSQEQSQCGNQEFIPSVDQTNLTSPHSNPSPQLQPPLQHTTNPSEQIHQAAKDDGSNSDTGLNTRPGENNPPYSTTGCHHDTASKQILAQVVPPSDRLCDWCRIVPTTVYVTCDMRNGYCFGCFRYH